MKEPIIVLTALMMLTGCRVDPVAKGYAERIAAHDAAVYQQAEYFAKLADRRAYPDATTRPWADPMVIDRHRASIQEGRDLTKAFVDYANTTTGGR